MILKIVEYLNKHVMIYGQIIVFKTIQWLPVKAGYCRHFLFFPPRIPMGGVLQLGSRRRPGMVARAVENRTVISTLFNRSNNNNWLKDNEPR